MTLQRRPLRLVRSSYSSRRLAHTMQIYGLKPARITNGPGARRGVPKGYSDSLAPGSGRLATRTRPDRYNLDWPGPGMAAAGRAGRPRWRSQPRIEL